MFSGLLANILHLRVLEGHRQKSFYFFQIIHHILTSLLIFMFLVSLFGNMPPASFISEWLGHLISPNTYCWTSGFIAWFLVSYSSAGSFGMSLYRLLYVKEPNWVKFKVGEKTLLFAVALGGVAISMMVSWLYGLGRSTGRFLNNFCFGHSEKFEVKNINSKTIKTSFNFLPKFILEVVCEFENSFKIK